VEVECDTVAQFCEAIAAGADLILLDNMSLAELRRCVQVAPPGVLLEASGGLCLEVAHAVAATGVTYLAVGALTHSAPILDLGMDLRSGLGKDPRARAAPPAGD
jgi:nicotinate-nucleotide pyrophosphorylase (carboxylating)